MLLCVFIVGALVIGASQEAALMVFLFTVGRSLEHVVTATAQVDFVETSESVKHSALQDVDDFKRSIEGSSMSTDIFTNFGAPVGNSGRW